MGLGAILTQKDDFGREYVIAYVSQSNNMVEANYSSYKGEALAAVWIIAHFWPYLYSQRFTLVTDHQPLQWLIKSDKLTSKLVKWVLLLHEYDFEVVHHVGITNLNVDGLSHNPSSLDEDLIGARWHGDCDREAILGWHAAAYLTCLFGISIEVPIHGSNDKMDRPQAIVDI